MNQSEPRKHEILAETQYLRLVQAGHWTYAQRPNAIGAVGIVAITNERKIVLVEQYRIPLEASVIELPAGLVGDEPDKEDESMDSAAFRELLEETGYEAKTMSRLADGVSSGGLTDECVTLMLANGLERRHAGGGTSNESIIVHEVHLDDVLTWIKAQQLRGCLIDFKVYAGLYLAAAATETLP